MSEKIKYNLPGFGFAECFVFENASRLLDLLDNYHLVDKLKNTYQLGTMRYVYPGAHHTRYEYIYTQLMLISNLVMSKEKSKRSLEISLGSCLNEFKNLGYNITGGDILQCLAILSNAGHMYDTFTSSKIITKLLRESRNSRTPFYEIYKRNLPRELHETFVDIINQNNYYKLHLFNMIHLLKGMVRSKDYEPFVQMFTQLLIRLLDPSKIKNEATQRIFTLYKKIRKIAYLSIDMVYTPAFFGANLNRMLYTLPNSIDELFDDESPVSKAILQLEEIIHKQIYDSSECIINSTRIEQTKYGVYKKIVDGIDDIFKVRSFIMEINEPYSQLSTTRQPTEITHMVQNSELHLSGLPVSKITENPYYDDLILQNIPNTRIAYGSQISQNLKKAYTVFSLLSNKDICLDSQIIVKTAIAMNLYDHSEKIDLIKFAIKSIYKYNEFFFSVYPPNNIDINQCVFIGNGSKTLAKQIKNVFSAETVDNADTLHEINCCVKVLESIPYSGLIMCFVGGIKASKYNETKKIDELDGFIYFPNKDPKDMLAIIVEAKNYGNGGNDAERQLVDTARFLSNDLTSNIIKENKFAYMEICKKS